MFRMKYAVDLVNAEIVFGFGTLFWDLKPGVCSALKLNAVLQFIRIWILLIQIRVI